MVAVKTFKEVFYHLAQILIGRLLIWYMYLLFDKAIFNIEISPDQFKLSGTRKQQRRWEKSLQSPVWRKGLQRQPSTEVDTHIMGVWKPLLMQLGKMAFNSKTQVGSYFISNCCAHFFSLICVKSWCGRMYHFVNKSFSFLVN